MAGDSSLYNPTMNGNMDRPPWIDDKGKTISREQLLQNADPTGITLGAFDKSSQMEEFIAPARMVAAAASRAKTPQALAACTKQMNALTRNMVNNVLMSRAGWYFESMLDPKGRDLYRECGYPLAISAQIYREMYDRDGIAARVTDILSEECWERPCTVYEDESEKANTPFEIEWKKLCEQHNLIHFMERIDKLSGIGSYGLILLGVDDGKPLNEPIDGLDENTGELEKTIKKQKLLYVRTFDESLCHVGQWCLDPHSPRYAQPLVYLIRFLDYTTVPIGQTATDMMTHMVHWSRVVHIADNRKSSEVFGVPRMQNVFNRLLDLRKLYGGSAEMFWKGGFPGIGLEVMPEYADGQIDLAATKTQLDEYQNSLKRFFAVAGMKIVTLNPNIAQPKEHIEAQLQAISIAKGVPWRVFVGSEQAVKAGEQDSDAWDVRLQRRKDNYLSPMLVRPLVERLIAMGVLSRPEDQFHISWPDASVPTLKDKAQLATSFANALSVYVTTGVEQMMAPMDFLMTVIGLEKSVAEEVIGNAQAYAEEQMAQQAEQAGGMMPSAQDLSDSTGLDPDSANVVIQYIMEHLQQVQQQSATGIGGASDTSGDLAASPYEQMPAKQQDSSGAISGGVAGGMGSSGTVGTPSGGVPWSVGGQPNDKTKKQPGAEKSKKPTKKKGKRNE